MIGGDFRNDRPEIPGTKGRSRRTVSLCERRVKIISETAVLDAWDCPKRNDVVILPAFPRVGLYLPITAAHLVVYQVEPLAAVSATDDGLRLKPVGYDDFRQLKGVGLLPSLAPKSGSDGRR